MQSMYSLVFLRSNNSIRENFLSLEESGPAKWIGRNRIAYEEDACPYSVQCDWVTKWHIAAMQCCDMGMSLATFEDDEEAKCFAKILYEQYDFKGANNIYWVGASNLHSLEGEWNWCGEKSSRPFLNTSAIDNLNRGPKENCLALQKIESDGKLTYVALSCSNVHFRFICKKDRVVNDALDKMRGTNTTSVDVLNGPSFLMACNRIYLFGLENKIWSDANLECCSYGLRPFSLQNQEEWKCLSQSNKENIGLFWTSGLRMELADKNFTWCNKSEIATFIPWAQHQPENSENRCLAVAFEEKVEWSGFQDTPCRLDLPVVCTGDLA